MPEPPAPPFYSYDNYPTNTLKEKNQMYRTRLAAAAAGVALAATGLAVAAAPAAQACVAINAQGGGWGGTKQTCLPDGGKQICDNGWAPFVGPIENCFIAYPGHPRY